MAKKSQIIKCERSKTNPKFKCRRFNRCSLCGRPRAYYRKFGVCRICLRNLANKGEIPGMKKASW